MGNIAEYLRTLRTAVFGKDVRESIAKSIEQTYEDATRSGNANMEVSDARGYYSSLKNRLDTENNNMQSQINGLASGSPLVASSVSEMTDTSRVYVNTSNGHWYTYNGSTWADGGVYQAAEDSNSVNRLKVSENDIINATVNTSWNYMSYSDIIAGWYMQDGTFRSEELTDTSLCSLKYNVDANKKYFVSARCKWQAVAIAFFKDNTFLGYMGYNPEGDEDLQNFEQYIYTPNNCNIMYVCCYRRTNINIKYYAKKYTFSLKNGELSKKWVAFGDSLTDSATLADQTQKENYTNFVAEEVGLEMTNCGKGGTGYINNNPYPSGTGAFWQRVNTIPSNTDIITIFGSFNDGYDYTNYTLGQVSDITTDTLYGAMNYFLSKIYEINPNIIVGIILPTPWYNWSRKNLRNGHTLEYIEALKNFANYNSLPVLNLFDESGMRPWDSEFRANNYKNGDGIHPNSQAHKKYIAPKIANFIKSIIN